MPLNFSHEGIIQGNFTTFSSQIEMEWVVAPMLPTIMQSSYVTHNNADKLPEGIQNKGVTLFTTDMFVER